MVQSCIPQLMGAKSACSVFARPAGAAPRSTNATWRLQNSRKSALFSWSNHKISPAALCNDRNGHITAENRECFYFGGPGARGPRTCGWEHTFREINLAPPCCRRRRDPLQHRCGCCTPPTVEVTPDAQSIHSLPRRKLLRESTVSAPNLEKLSSDCLRRSLRVALARSACA